MAHTSRRLKAIAVLCAGALLAGNAHAILGAFFYAKVKTESEVIAGLDEPTRKLIESLPANLRAEAVKALTEAQPMIDQSIAKYFEDLDTRLANRIDQIGCVLSNTATGAVESLKGPWGEKTPITTLKNDYDSRKHFNPKKVENLAYTYVDLVAAIAKAGCGVYDPKGKAIVAELRAVAGQRMSTWHQLKDFCTTPADCLEKRYAYVGQLIANADKRDLDFTKAKALYEKVNGKPVSKVGPGFFSDRSLKWTNDENELVKLFEIDRSIDTAQALRAQNGKLYMRDAGLVLAKAEQALALAKSKLSTTSVADNDAAIKYAGEAQSYRTEVTDTATAAANAHDSQKPDASRVLTRISQIQSEATGVVDSAGRYKDNIARAAEAERIRIAAEEAEKARNKVECKGKNGCVGGPLSH